MEKTERSVDDFLAALPEGARDDMQRLDREITRVMQGQTRTLWEGVFWGGSPQAIIGYGDVRYERPRKTVEWFMVGLARQKSYISVYVNAVEDGRYLAETHAGGLGKVKVGKSSIGFTSLDDIDLDALLDLVRLARETLAAP